MGWSQEVDGWMPFSPKNRPGASEEQGGWSTWRTCLNRVQDTCMQGSVFREEGKNVQNEKGSPGPGSSPGPEEKYVQNKKRMNRWEVNPEWCQNEEDVFCIDIMDDSEDSADSDSENSSPRVQRTKEEDANEGGSSEVPDSEPEGRE